MLTLLIVVVLVLALVGGAPVWPHSREWGAGPSGVVGLILVVLLVLWLTGHRL